jgi:DNA-binding NarL/FixJ family response regulator
MRGLPRCSAIHALSGDGRGSIRPDDGGPSRCAAPPSQRTARKSLMTQDVSVGIHPSTAEDPTTPRDGAPARLRVAVVTEVCLYREGLASSLGRRAETEVVGTAAALAEAVDLVRRERPDVLLLDMATADAPRVVHDARGAHPGVRVVALAIVETEEVVLRCAEAGVAGYVSRSASLDDLVETLGSVARGELVCSRSIAGSLFRRVGALSGPREDPALARLTPREREIAALIGRGLSNKEISRRLRIGLSTVKNHVHNLLEKLQVPGRSAAAARLRGVEADPGAGGALTAEARI